MNKKHKDFEKYFTKKEIAAAKKIEESIEFDGTIGLFQGIRFIEAPAIDLTTKQRMIIELVMEGKTNFEIGVALNLFEGGVKYHLTNLYKKFKVKSRHALIAAVAERKLWNQSSQK
jgi:DNA-binding CsgD family transcriptional regulator